MDSLSEHLPITKRIGGQEARTRKLAELERLFQAIRSDPIDVVDDLVGSIRANRQDLRSRAIAKRGERPNVSVGSNLLMVYSRKLTSADAYSFQLGRRRRRRRSFGRMAPCPIKDAELRVQRLT